MLLVVLVAVSSDPECPVPRGGGTPLWEGAEPGPALLCPPQAQAAAPEQLWVCEAKGLGEGVSSASQTEHPAEVPPQ